ncbi:MAG: hypothetical protein V3T83_06820, partial [Acidobacteriota bacterium]
HAGPPALTLRTRGENLAWPQIAPLSGPFQSQFWGKTFRGRLYIRNQPEHQRRKTFQEEFVELLRKHKVDFDEKYLWD